MGAIAERLTAAAGRLGARFPGADPTATVVALDDAALIAALRDATEARNVLDLIGAAASAEIERRSVRELGHTGLAQRTGHRTATSFIQEVTGQSAGEVRRATAAGVDLASVAGDDLPADTADCAEDEADGGHESGVGADDGDGDRRRDASPWHAPLTRAFADDRLARDQYDAIRRNLGEPPCERYAVEFTEQIRAAWREAAVMLIDESRDRVLEDLRAAARLARDTLDPIGTQLRFEERFERRSFRMWVDDDGQVTARIRFDDEAALWSRTILNAALRPRRGPRFVDAEGGSGEGGTSPGDATASGGANEDTRTNEQLQYDTIMAVLRTGAEADPNTIFGGRQPGVRVVITHAGDARSGDVRSETTAPGAPPGGVQPWARGGDGVVGFAEETGQAVPAGYVDKQVCDAGTRPIAVDAEGRPLDVGREARLFTPRQRIAIAERDGGCLWCGAEPSRCEVHHIDPWSAGGRTDVADGVLLCRNCHMRLHNQRLRIRRDGDRYRTERPPAAGSDGRGTGGRRGDETRPLRSNRLRRFERLGAAPAARPGAQPP